MTKGNSFVTATEMVLLHLVEFPSYEGEIEGPLKVTQIGISNAIGVPRNNIPRSLIPLVENGQLSTHKAHIPGIRLKRNIYYLTQLGVKAATELKKQILEQHINIIDYEGNEESVRIVEAMRLIPFDIRLTDVFRETTDQTFDYRSFQNHVQRSERRLFGEFKSLSTPENFTGRKEEIGKIKDWYDNNKISTLTISGMPGIGKTTLISRAVELCPHDCDVY